MNIESKEKPPELVDLYNELNQPLERVVSRDQAHAEGLWHRTVHIYLTRTTDSGVEVLVHVRSKTKKQYAGKFDPVFGGHIQSGSDAEQTALSELQEETGLNPQKEKLIFHGFIKKDDEVNAPNDREFNMLFTYELSAEEKGHIKLQGKEVESADWMPLAELRTRVMTAEDQWRPSLRELSESLDVVFGEN